MKKLLAILLALAAIGGFAFADDAAPALTFGAYGDITATLYNDAGNTGYGLYTETYFNYAAKDMGFSATTVAAGDMFAAFRNYSFWYSFNNGMVKVYAGLLREAAGVRLTSVIDGNGFSTRLANINQGLLVTAKPVDGLVVSAFVPLTGAAVATDFQAANFGAAYLVKDVANFVAGYRLANKELYVGADVKAVKDLTLKVGYKMVDPTNYIYLTAGYTMDKLTFNLDSDFVLGTAFNFGAQVQAEYAVSDFLTAGAKVWYDTGADAWYAADGIAFKPYVQCNFAKGDIIVGFKYNADGSWSIPVDFEISY